MVALAKTTIASRFTDTSRPAAAYLIRIMSATAACASARRPARPGENCFFAPSIRAVILLAP